MHSQTISLDELSKHETANSAWLVINGTVWDVTGFAELHPGGPDIIEQHFGKDASNAYNDVHGPKLAISHFGDEKMIGQIAQSVSKQPSLEMVSSNPKLSRDPPPMESIINLQDFEDAARCTLNERSWVYISGAADDGYSAAKNAEIYKNLFLRPRVLNAVGDVNTTTVILNETFDVPIFNAPASLSMLAHPKAEVALAAGLAASGSTIIIPTLASYSQDEIINSLPAKHPFFFQLYVHRDSKITEKLLDDISRSQPKAIMVTADLPVFSKREANERYQIRMAQENHNPGQPYTQARSAGAAIDPDLTWKHIRFIQERTGIAVFIKGIQCAEDAAKALEYGCAGIYISNHGGRGVDTAQPTLLTLAEINLRYPEVLNKMEVFIDGGIRRGTDVLKAICLGARGVCLGRPFFNSLVYGEDGVKHLMKLLRDELESAMQLCGITRLDQAHPGLLNTRHLLNLVDNGTWPQRETKL